MPRCSNPRCQTDCPPGATQCINSRCGCLLPDAIVGGRYCVETLVGMGGIGAIYRVSDLFEMTTVALKILRTDIHRDAKSAIDDFTREARYGYQLRHKNIVPALNFGQDAGFLYFTMPLITGGTLKGLLQNERPLPTEQAIRFLIDISNAIDTVHAHPMQLIHRDIKPTNLLIHQDDGRLLLADFGISRMRGEIPLEIRGWAVGTEHYSAPEAEYGRSIPASDIFSMGVVAYQMFTGLLPFQAVVRNRASELPRPSMLNPSLPGSVDAIISRAMHIDPNKRYDSATSFVIAFEDAMNFWPKQKSEWIPGFNSKNEILDVKNTKTPIPTNENFEDAFAPTDHTRVIPYDYDVALSYAGEDRQFASALFTALDKRSIKVFYDQYEKSAIWGKNLFNYLNEIYYDKARYCIVLLSQHYAAKTWTKHELQAAQARAMKDREAYILPIRLDNTDIPSILPTIAYLNWNEETVDTIADAIVIKLKFINSI